MQKRKGNKVVIDSPFNFTQYSRIAMFPMCGCSLFIFILFFDDRDLDCTTSESRQIRFKIFLLLDLHSMKFEQISGFFLSNFTYFLKNQGAGGKFTVLAVCRVNDMANKI